MTLKPTCRLLILCGASYILGTTVSFARDDGISLEPDLICRSISAPRDTLCPKLEHFRLRLQTTWDPGIQLRLAYDPQQPPKITWWHTYSLGLRRLPSRKSWLHDYAIRLTLSRSWDLSLEDWSAATLLPDASGIGFAYALQDSGWNQTALRLTWLNPDRNVLAASIILGLGEGERLKELDAEPYTGGLIRLALFEGGALQIGASFDANSLEADQLFWLDPEQSRLLAPGFAAHRYALAFVLDGQQPWARGFRLSIGRQLNQIKGRRLASWPVSKPQDGPFDPSDILSEQLGGRGLTERAIWSFSASYEILAEYLIAYQWQNLRVDLEGDARFVSCGVLDAQGLCTGASTTSRRLLVDGQTWGIGWRSDGGSSVMLESYVQRYDRLYELYHLAAAADRRHRSVQVVQLRVRADL